MSRPIRILFPGAVYHIMSRGNGGQDIFWDKEDFHNFLLVFADVLDKYNIISYAYCLMPNHYHLLLETPDPNLPQALRQLNGKYTQKFNIRHKRYGHLFQDRYKSILVELERYRFEIIRYIVLNPVKAKLVDEPSQWIWSSHREMIGKLKKPSGFLDQKLALGLFDEDRARAKKFYLQSLDKKMEGSLLDDELELKTVLGSEKFIDSVKGFFEKQNKSKEIPKTERFVHRPRLEKIFDLTEDKTGRNRKIKKAYLEFGYTLAEIGKHLKIHYTTVSLIVNKIDKT